jgi:hypothetical protein
MPQPRLALFLTAAILLTACQAAKPVATVTPDPSPSLAPSPIPSVTGFTPDLSASPEPTSASLPAKLELDPADWQNWPINPTVTENVRQIYLHGQALGNNPHSFSVFGDCQTTPQNFMGVYESNPPIIAALPPNLLETVNWFNGSFDRASPTAKAGTTTGALLWSLWHENKFTCTSTESPIQCELRIHKPSYVIIQVGTHYEDRNQEYMRKVLDQVIAAGVVPILTSKADDRELNGHINAEYAQLAVEYNIPFWNFWAAVKDLPNRGLYTQPSEPGMVDIYLTNDAMAIHRLTCLQALDTVRRAVTAGQ